MEKEGDNSLRDKKVAYYAALANAWLSTRMEKDKSLLFLSAGGIGLLITLMISAGLKETYQIVLFIFATSFFIIALFSLIWIFGRNATYLEKEIKGISGEDKILTALDAIAQYSFILGVITAFVIAITFIIK